MLRLLHLALGASAAGNLRAACHSYGLPGSVLVVQDDLSHGPLGDGRLRAAYLRDCDRGYGDDCFDAVDAFEPWRALMASIDEGQPEVVVWGGDNVSDAIFLRMTCWWLGNRPVRLRRVTVPPKEHVHYLPVHTPVEIAALYATAQNVSDDERALYAEDFLRIHEEASQLRRWEAGRIISVPMDLYDALLLEVCTTEWVPAARLVGTAMSRCDGHNLMSDLFFCSRMQRMIDEGLLEADTSPTRLRDYSVRMPIVTQNPARGDDPQ